MSHRESEALGIVWFDIATAGSSHSVPNGDRRLEDNLRDRSGVERLHQPGEPAHPTVLWVMLGAREHVKSPVERRAWTCNPPCSLTAVLDCASAHRSEVSAHCSARVCQTPAVGNALPSSRKSWLQPRRTKRLMMLRLLYGHRPTSRDSPFDLLQFCHINSSSSSSFLIHLRPSSQATMCSTRNTINIVNL